MGKVTYIKSSRKEHKCRKCGKVIAVGQPYYRGIINFHPDIIRCVDCKLQSWEVTTSDYVLQVGEIVHNWRENYDINEETPADIAGALQEVLDECQERLDNMPESLQYSPTGEMLQERIDNLQEAIDNLESIDIDDLKSQSVESVMSELDDYDSEKTYDFDEEHEKGQENGIADDLTNDLNEKIADEIESALSSVEV